MAKEIVSADVATGARVAFATIADHVVGAWIQLALVGMRVTGGQSVWAATRTTTDFTAKQRITVVVFDATIAIVAGGEVLTSNTFAGVRVAGLTVSITLAHLTVGEVPEAGLTLVTLTTVCIRMAITLACDQVAVVVGGTDAVTIASCRVENVRF